MCFGVRVCGTGDLGGFPGCGVRDDCVVCAPCGCVSIEEDDRVPIANRRDAGLKLDTAISSQPTYSLPTAPLECLLLRLARRGCVARAQRGEPTFAACIGLARRIAAATVGRLVSRIVWASAFSSGVLYTGFTVRQCVVCERRSLRGSRKATLCLGESWLLVCRQTSG